MKKIFAILAIVASGMLMSSCSRDYTCTCVRVQTDAGGAVISTNQSSNIINGTKGKATDECKEGERVETSGQFTTTYTCDVARFER